MINVRHALVFSARAMRMSAPGFGACSAREWWSRTSINVRRLDSMHVMQVTVAEAKGVAGCRTTVCPQLVPC